jgi:preprotein translocase subunit SecE
MNRQTKRLLAKQEKRAERERARSVALGGGKGGSGGGRGGSSGGRGGGSGPGGGASSSGAGASPSTERVGRIARWRRFIREVRQELKKVAWPTRGEVVTYTVVVLVSVMFVTTLVFALDYVLGEGAFELYST